MSTNALLITGNTYPHRRTLRGFGCLFDRDEMGYIVSSENALARDYANNQDDLDVSDYEATDEQLTPATGERLRAIRQDKINRRRERLLSQADAADRRAEEQRNRVSKQERDFLSLGEPIKVGHHSERRHRRLVDKAWDSTLKAGAEYAKAEELRQKAAWLMPAQVKGDAAKRQQARRDKADNAIDAGDLVRTSIYGEATVIKVNKKTFRICISKTGKELNVDKGYCTLLEKRPLKNPSKPQFKKGDRVLVKPWHHRPPEKGVILRRTPNGYSVEYSWRFGKETQIRTSKATFQVSEIELDSEVAA